ncbi:MAG: IS5/IS1182 family transposase, partial [Pseudomonadota bacterium]
KGGQFWTPIPPLRGSTFHADPQTRFGVRQCLSDHWRSIGSLIRTIGLARAEAKLTLANMAYNFDRLIFHERRRAMG